MVSYNFLSSLQTKKHTSETVNRTQYHRTLADSDLNIIVCEPEVFVHHIAIEPVRSYS